MLAGALPLHQPVPQAAQGDHADRQQRRDRFAAFLPHEDPEHDAAHAEDGQDRAHHVHAPIAGVGHVADELDPREHDDDHDRLEQERDPPGEVGGDGAADQRTHRRHDRGRGTDLCVHTLLRFTLEVPVDERLHGGEEERSADATDERPEHDDRSDALGQRHRQRADHVAEEPEHVRTLPADQVADLAPDEDEGRGHQRLERDRALHAAHRRVEVVDDCADRHVHDRRVHDQHEHGHREEEPELVVARLLGHRNTWPGAGARPRAPEHTDDCSNAAPGSLSTSRLSSSGAPWTSRRSAPSSKPATDRPPRTPPRSAPGVKGGPEGGCPDARSRVGQAVPEVLERRSTPSCRSWFDGRSSEARATSTSSSVGVRYLHFPGRRSRPPLRPRPLP